MGEKEAGLHNYLVEIQQNLHRLEEVTTSPDGSRNGKRGDILLFRNGTARYIAVNIDSSTAWSGTILSPLP